VQRLLIYHQGCSLGACNQLNNIFDYIFIDKFGDFHNSEKAIVFAKTHDVKVRPYAECCEIVCSLSSGVKFSLIPVLHLKNLSAGIKGKKDASGCCFACGSYAYSPSQTLVLKHHFQNRRSNF
jgi:hypothetical protein